ITWNATPANVVKVTARRTGTDTTKPDGKLKLAFGGVVGNRYAQVQTQAIAYVDARDIVVVHDFSRSMNFDSYFSDEATTRLTDTQIVTNLGYVWTDLNMTVGNFTFDPQYLSQTLTDDESGISTTGVFKVNAADVSTGGTLKKIVTSYRYKQNGKWANSSQTF